MLDGLIQCVTESAKNVRLGALDVDFQKIDVRNARFVQKAVELPHQNHL